MEAVWKVVSPIMCSGHRYLKWSQLATGRCAEHAVQMIGGLERPGSAAKETADQVSFGVGVLQAVAGLGCDPAFVGGVEPAGRGIPAEQIAEGDHLPDVAVRQEDRARAAERSLEHGPLRRPDFPVTLAREAQPQERLSDSRHVRRVHGDLRVHHVLADQARDGGTADMLGNRARPSLGDQRRDLRSRCRGPAIGPMRPHALIGPLVPLLTDRLTYHQFSLLAGQPTSQDDQSYRRDGATRDSICVTLVAPRQRHGLGRVEVRRQVVIVADIFRRTIVSNAKEPIGPAMAANPSRRWPRGSWRYVIERSSARARQFAGEVRLAR